MIPKLASVVIPAFNRAGLLEQAVQCALAQDYPHKEIIVIDDGSTDDTAARMKSFPVEFFSQQNAGPSAARNHGLRRARGEFIAYLDSDDLWEPNYLSESIAGLEATGAGFVFSNWRGILEDGRMDYPDYFSTLPHLERFRGKPQGNWFVLTPKKGRELLLQNSIGLPSGTVMRRAVMGCEWDEQARVGEDRLFLIDTIFHAQCPVGFTGKILWSHRLHSANSFVGNPNLGKMSERDIYSKEAILKKYGGQLSEAERKILRQSIAGNYFDWGYHASCEGRRQQAVAFYFKSLSRRPSAKTALAILKTLIKPKPAT